MSPKALVFGSQPVVLFGVEESLRGGLSGMELSHWGLTLKGIVGF